MGVAELAHILVTSGWHPKSCQDSPKRIRMYFVHLCLYCMHICLAYVDIICKHLCWIITSFLGISQHPTPVKLKRRGHFWGSRVAKKFQKRQGCPVFTGWWLCVFASCIFKHWCFRYYLWYRYMFIDIFALIIYIYTYLYTLYTFNYVNIRWTPKGLSGTCQALDRLRALLLAKEGVTAFEVTCSGADAKVSERTQLRSFQADSLDVG